MAGQNGYWFSLYTWKDGEVYVLMDDVGYGIHGRGYCFEPYQGIIEENVHDMILAEKESDYCTILYTTYHKVTTKRPLDFSNGLMYNLLRKVIGIEFPIALSEIDS